MARRRNTLLVFGAIVACLLIAIWQVKRVRAGVSSRDKDSAAAARDSNQNIPWAAVAQVKRGPLSNSLSIAGQFVPYQEVALHAKVAGYIRQINVDIGDRVHAGQVLATLEIPELVAQVDAAKAGVHHAEEEIARAKSDVARAEADHVALHANSLRLVNTDKARPGLIAGQELDDANAKDRASQAQVEAAKSALSATKQQLEVARADQQHYSALSDYSRITAPFDGVVTWRFADTGSLVQAGTSSSTGQPVVTVAEVSTLRLRIPVPESLAAKVRVGDPAEVTVQATGEHFTGKVARFTGALDPATRTMQVEIEVPNRDDKLRPGMYAQVSLQVQDRPNSLSVPVQAVQQHNGTATVLVLDAQNQVQQRAIQTGIEDPDRVEVLSGLQAGEYVIVGNFAAYHAGQRVQPKQADTPAEVTGGDE